MPRSWGARKSRPTERLDGLQTLAPQLAHPLRFIDALVDVRCPFEIKGVARLRSPFLKTIDETLRPVVQNVFDGFRFFPISDGISLRLAGTAALPDLTVDAARVLWIRL